MSIEMEVRSAEFLNEDICAFAINSFDCTFEIFHMFIKLRQID